MQISIGPNEYDLEDLIVQLNTDLLAIDGLQFLQERKQETLELLRSMRKSSPE